jgi:hypothetical protein
MKEKVAMPSPAPLHFKGLSNLERTLEVLSERFDLADARRVVVQGGSAGGLSTYLHLDRITDRIRALKAKFGDKSNLRVVGRPVAGFFIDAARYQPPPGIDILTSSQWDFYVSLLLNLQVQ